VELLLREIDVALRPHSAMAGQRTS